MRYGCWLPIFGGWLRNIDDERMPATLGYVRKLTTRAEELGYDFPFIAELNLNDIKARIPFSRRLAHRRRARRRHQETRAH
jgi:hypothetical protein